MDRIHLQIILFLTFISLPAVRSAACWRLHSVEYGGECFLYYTTIGTYTEARDVCQSNGGVLATVKNMTQLEETTKDIPDNTVIWIGANNMDDETKWVWEEGDGTVAADLSQLWMPDSCQPDNFNKDEHCAVFVKYDSGRQGLHDVNCEIFKFGFLCQEVPMTTDPMTATGTTNDPADTNTAASTADTSGDINTADSTTDTSGDTNTADSTTDTSGDINTAASTADTSADTNTADSTTDTSGDTNTADSTTGTSADTNTAASTAGTSATVTTADSTSGTSATTLTTSTHPTASTTHSTATTVTITTKPTTKVILTSTSKVTESSTTVKKSGANFIDLNVLLLLNLFAFNVLIL